MDLKLEGYEAKDSIHLAQLANTPKKICVSYKVENMASTALTTFFS
jgi:hypothetical protein